MYHDRKYPMARGLMSYGASLVDASRLCGVYVGRILNQVATPQRPVYAISRAAPPNKPADP
jgi:hypothetical protein